MYCIASAGTCEQRQFSGWCASPMQITAWSKSQPNPGKSGACSVPGMQSVQLSHRVTWATSVSFSVGISRSLQWGSTTISMLAFLGFWRDAKLPGCVEFPVW
ncbi:hypothetical protein CBS63078_8235 [Aspergillus niger]|nr:hypothetical protein CBS133816_8297 [Aspergillus niger]KAI2852505.1 hypothetical protein CBS12448_8311 [Aspergillus niger]KAI2873857.1 hypothetical protein CBS13152_9839 [Aspergillus niger]KAI2896538.1 hypothetical protein CBS63078_8235 [Aspergillus niger]KAI2925615.1 hypothetical protein CBS147320_6126 [Aspergillus niger]